MSTSARAASTALSLAAGSLAASACAITRLDLLLVAGGAVLDAAEVAALLWGSAVLTTFPAVGLAVLPRRWGSRPSASVAAAAAGVLLAGVLIGSGAWVAGALAFSALASGDPAASTVLRPPPGLGCTLVVREGAFLRTSSGRLFTVARSGVASPGASWRADEVQLPVRDGAFSVLWRRGGGTIHLEGARPVDPAAIDFTCPG